MNHTKRKLLVFAAAMALLGSVVIGTASDALADGGVSTNGITWCRTCN